MTWHTRRTRDTGDLLTVGTAVELGADPEGGKWVIICEEHSTLVNVDTREVAMNVRGIDFCDEGGHRKPGEPR